MRKDKAAALALRVVALCAAWWFAALSHNPVVRLEAILGLSPSPLEKLAGIRGPFSGMTEGMYQLAHGELSSALKANVLTPFAAALFVACVVLGIRPRVTTRASEVAFFSVFVVATAIVNWFA
jgi:hypothetical protein